MEKLQIRGGNILEGEIDISGAKNSALPILSAVLLTDQQMFIHNVPHLKDVTTMISLLANLGVNIQLEDDMCISATLASQSHCIAPYDMVKTMRASILVLGPLLAHFGEAKVALPGGCAIGSRPINLHIEALRTMGADIKIIDGYIHAQCQNRLRGTTFVFESVTVTGTENIVMAATLATGTTRLENCAREPEVTDLANCLNAMGAKITGHGTNTIIIEGVKKLHGARHYVLPDRIETGTYLVAAAATCGNIRVNNTQPKLLESVKQKLIAAGASVHSGDTWMEVDNRNKRPKAVSIATSPYPGLPTDIQAQFIALNTIAEGACSVTENIFENRFMHALEMQRMGANITLRGNTAIITGIPKLQSAPVQATDLRASASLVIAGMVTEGGITEISRIYHIDRGYETIEEKFSKLGADIQRIPS